MCIKNYTAGGAVAKYRIAKFGSADGVVVQGAAATDALIGVFDIPVAAATGDRVDVVRDDFCEIEYGGTITRGDPLTSDSNGKAVAAAPAAGANVRIIGFAEVSGVAGSIEYVLVSPSIMQGA